MMADNGHLWACGWASLESALILQLCPWKPKLEGASGPEVCAPLVVLIAQARGPPERSLRLTRRPPQVAQPQRPLALVGFRLGPGGRALPGGSARPRGVEASPASAVTGGQRCLGGRWLVVHPDGRRHPCMGSPLRQPAGAHGTQGGGHSQGQPRPPRHCLLLLLGHDKSGLDGGVPRDEDRGGVLWPFPTSSLMWHGTCRCITSGFATCLAGI